MSPNEHFRTNEHLECLESLGLVNECLRRIPDHPYRWKWLVVSAHNAAQGAMVLALKGTWPIRVMEDSQIQKKAAHKRPGIRNREEILEAHSLGIMDLKSEARLRLRGFMSLYTSLKSPAKQDMGLYIDSCAFRPGEEIDDRVTSLNDLRNILIHYQPMSLVMARSTIFDQVNAAMDVVEFALLHSQNVTWYSDEDEDNVSMLIEQIRQGLAVLREK